MKKLFVVLALAPVVLAAGCMYKSEREVERNSQQPEKETVEKRYYEKEYVPVPAERDRVDVHIDR